MELPDPIPNSEVKRLSAHDTGFSRDNGSRPAFLLRKRKFMLNIV